MDIKIKTGLKGETNKNILEGVMGQLSDGIWENSRAMTKYWSYMDIVEEDGELCIEVPSNFHVLWNMDADPQAVKTWFAKKVKAVAKEYLKDFSWEGGEWKRDCTVTVHYFHGNYAAKTWPTVAEAYNAYEVLLGRKS